VGHLDVLKHFRAFGMGLLSAGGMVAGLVIGVMLLEIVDALYGTTAAKALVAVALVIVLAYAFIDEYLKVVRRG
jgi:uncharacterized protein YacL